MFLFSNLNPFRKLGEDTQSSSAPMNARVENNKRISSARISELNPGEIFVFGSNKSGQHAGGAAYIASMRFGAVWGEGEGLYGQSYALPTMEGEQSFHEAVLRFTDFARSRHDLTFLVTAVGCGIAGYTEQEVAPWFEEASQLPNVYLPAEFWNVISKK